ncbi:RbsD/FucU domain-containing protein [Antrihabitans cavernicola]|uniref:D-ribose pyranase n=1 Tax=Antrihabitans cavernicola TaxID=2495913 RepID=A0A5A7SBP7_9NOCA|nr:RbsD/FucU domain-containing protein [Spelaeibacter cavernicola]KAA0021651.1 RbsD or FucU transport [Spelaeibacter cavernicola]
MITGTIIHPDIVDHLARTGHGGRVLVSDAHWASSTRIGSHAHVVHLGLRPGLPTVPDVVAAVRDTVAIEQLVRMRPSPDAEPCLVQRATAELLTGVPIEMVEREQFYQLATGDDVALVVVTGDIRRFGNALLRVGVTTERS